MATFRLVIDVEPIFATYNTVESVREDFEKMDEHATDGVYSVKRVLRVEEVLEDHQKSLDT